MPPTIETMPIIFGESIRGVLEFIMSLVSDLNYLRNVGCRHFLNHKEAAADLVKYTWFDKKDL